MDLGHVKLYPHQEEALAKLSTGKILYGPVGSGKTLTALVYYQRNHSDRKLLVITTAKKRDSGDWEREAALVGVTELTVDSWQNLAKYTDAEGIFLIADEQRLVGYGAWVKAFLKVVKDNPWILLSATPGDTWMDYVPVFIANGFYKNKTDFTRQHAVYNTFTKFPKVDRYVGLTKLYKLRAQILVGMTYRSHLDREFVETPVQYDREKYIQVWRDRWDVFKEAPIETISNTFYVARKVLNTDETRFLAVRALLEKHPRLVIFYNFDYELAILRELAEDVAVAEWNGHRHEDIPTSDSWVYLVQYLAGAEGWNCTETNAMCFYSLTYSYRMYKQAQGRIDRLDSQHEKLYYYTLMSAAPLDRAIREALRRKRSFNESSRSAYL
jgi:hypothetical protein